MKKAIFDFINNIGILRDALLYVQSRFTQRRYATMSAAHGSGFRFDGKDPDKPQFPLVGLEQAVLDCDRWIGHADTIGGNACVYDVKKGERLLLRYESGDAVLFIENVGEQVRLSHSYEKKFLRT